MHLDIASADVLATPQETYFKSQVSQRSPVSCLGNQPKGTLAVQPLNDPICCETVIVMVGERDCELW